MKRKTANSVEPSTYNEGEDGRIFQNRPCKIMRKATREIKIKRKTVRKVRTVNVKSKGRRPERSESSV